MILPIIWLAYQGSRSVSACVRTTTTAAASAREREKALGGPTIGLPERTNTKYYRPSGPLNSSCLNNRPLLTHRRALSYQRNHTNTKLG